MTQARILIVDDNAVIRATLKGIIKQDKQFIVIGEAASAQAALAAMEQTAPDVVCLDVLMPGMDGLSLLKRIREKHEDSRVVMITGEATAKIVKEALALGARGFVVKPFTAANVLHAIRQALA